MKRHSSVYPEAYGSIPKLVNHTGSATLGSSDSSRAHLHASDSNISSSVQAEGEGKKRMVRHMYEDVEIAQRDSSSAGAKSDSRTINWINHHTEMNWGRGEEGREMTGSMWSSRNRLHREHSKEKLRNGNTRRVSKTKSDQGREVLAAYQPPSTSTYRPQSSVPQPQHLQQPQHMQQPQHVKSQPSKGQDGRGFRGKEHPLNRGPTETLRSRRISYLSAMNQPTELPVKDTTTSSSRKEIMSPSSSTHYRSGDTASPAHHRNRDFPSTEYGMSYSTPGNSRHGNGNQLPGYGGGQTHLYSQRGSAHPPPMLHQRANKYAYDMTTPSHYRQSSDSSEATMVNTLEAMGRKVPPYLQHRTQLHGQRPHRTYSNERAYSHASPPQHEEDTLHSTKPHRTAQVESYL